MDRARHGRARQQIPVAGHACSVRPGQALPGAEGKLGANLARGPALFGGAPRARAAAPPWCSSRASLLLRPLPLSLSPLSLILLLPLFLRLTVPSPGIPCGAQVSRWDVLVAREGRGCGGARCAHRASRPPQQPPGFSGFPHAAAPARSPGRPAQSCIAPTGAVPAGGSAGQGSTEAEKETERQGQPTGGGGEAEGSGNRLQSAMSHSPHPTPAPLRAQWGFGPELGSRSSVPETSPSAAPKPCGRNESFTPGRTGGPEPCWRHPRS